MAPTCPQTWYEYYAMCRPLPPRYFTVFSGVSLLRTYCPYISLAYAPYDPHLAQHGPNLSPKWRPAVRQPFNPPQTSPQNLPIRPSGLVMAEDSGSARSATRTRRRAGAMAAGPPRMSPRGEPREKPLEAADSFKKHDISMET